MKPYLWAFSISHFMGFMQGYQPVASYAFGAKNEDRFHHSVRFALKGSLLFL